MLERWPPKQESAPLRVCRGEKGLVSRHVFVNMRGLESLNSAPQKKLCPIHCRHAPYARVSHSKQHQYKAALGDGSTVTDECIISERGTPFITGRAFYRYESAQGRDLAMLCASLHKQRTGSLRVLDVMAGSGVRGARYMREAQADEVWCNDFNPSNHNQLVYNLCSTMDSCSAQPKPTTAGTVATTNNSDAATGASQSDSGATPKQSNASLHQLVREAVTRWHQSAHMLVPSGLKRHVWQWQTGSGGDANSAQQQQQALSSHLGKTHDQGGAEHDQGVAQLQSPPMSAPKTHSDRGNRRGSGVHEAGTHVLHATEPPSDMTADTAQGNDSGGVGVSCTEAQSGRRRITVRVSQIDAKHLLAACYLNEDFYDLIDVDSFGSESAFLGNAIDSVKYGGLLYLTSTDGFSSSGRRPIRSLAAYGSYTRSLPCANEQGLRMLIGAAVKEGAARGVTLTPVYSLFSYHGPVFRVMLRAIRSAEWPSQHFKFIGHCHVHGVTSVVDWTDLGSAMCRCTHHDGSTTSPNPLTVAGPMWTGPLHNKQDVQDMIDEATRLGWSGHSPDAGVGVFGATARTKKNGPKTLEEMMQILLEESDDRLPPGFLSLDVLAQYLQGSPPRDKVIHELRAEGHAAARCHLDARAIRTSASIRQVVDAGARLGLARRQDQTL